MLVTIAAALLLPGFLIVSAWGPRRPTHLQLLTWVFPASIVYFALLGAVSALVAGVGGTSWRAAGVVTYTGILLAAAVRLRLSKRRPVFWGSGEHESLVRVAWLAFGLVIVVCFAMAIQHV